MCGFKRSRHQLRHSGAAQPNPESRDGVMVMSRAWLDCFGWPRKIGSITTLFATLDSGFRYAAPE